MFKYISLICSLSVVAIALTLMIGCAGSIPQDSSLERNWGRSFETQRHLQVANPDAGKQVKPVMAMDGASSDLVMEEYRKSFGAEGDEETVNIIKLK
jgi:hypothetical protein